MLNSLPQGHVYICEFSVLHLVTFIYTERCADFLARASKSLSDYLFVSPDIPCAGLPQTFFLYCLKYDLFWKTVLTILNMLS